MSRLERKEASSAAAAVVVVVVAAAVERGIGREVGRVEQDAAG